MSLLLCFNARWFGEGNGVWASCQWPKNKLGLFKQQNFSFLVQYHYEQSHNQNSKAISPLRVIFKSSAGERHFPNDHFSLWPFCCPFWWVIAFFEIFICELCHLQASWLKTVVCDVKVMEVSNMTLTVCFPQTTTFFPPLIVSSAFVRRIIQVESAVEKKEIHTAYKYSS